MRDKKFDFQKTLQCFQFIHIRINRDPPVSGQAVPWRGGWHSMDADGSESRAAVSLVTLASTRPWSIIHHCTHFVYKDQSGFCCFAFMLNKSFNICPYSALNFMCLGEKTAREANEPQRQIQNADFMLK